MIDCNYEDERELLLETKTAAAEAPYRATRAAAEPKGTKPVLDLGTLIPGMDAAKIDFAMLRAAFGRPPLTEHALADVDAPPKAGGAPLRGIADVGAPLRGIADVEWKQVWIAVFLAQTRAMSGDHLRARIALEITLEATRTPVYRAILLAHLAQHAAARGATKLAKRWLRACPEVAVAEAESEIRAARAMIAHAKGDYARVVEITGGNRAGVGFTGAAIWLALALNIDAQERRGDGVIADKFMDDIRRVRALMSLVPSIQGFGLKGAEASLLRSARATRRKRASSSGAFMAILVLGGLAFKHFGATACLVGGVIVGVASAITSWVFSASTRETARGRFVWGALEVAVWMAIASAVVNLMPRPAAPGSEESDGDPSGIPTTSRPLQLRLGAPPGTPP